MEPLAALIVPTEQGAHAVPSGPVYPAGQVQIELFATEEEFEGHEVQFVAATDDENVLTSHGTHDPSLAVFLYVPALQGVHTTPVGRPPESQSPIQEK